MLRLKFLPSRRHRTTGISSTWGLARGLCHLVSCAWPEHESMAGGGVRGRHALCQGSYERRSWCFRRLLNLHSGGSWRKKSSWIVWVAIETSWMGIDLIICIFISLMTKTTLQVICWLVCTNYWCGKMKGISLNHIAQIAPTSQGAVSTDY